MSEYKVPFLQQASLLPDWFTSEPGRALLKEQIDALSTLVPDQYYRVGLQYSVPEYSALKSLDVELPLHFDAGTALFSHPQNAVIAAPEAIPLAESSVDLALLFHTLDYCEQPHHVLREIAQVLSPEGVLVLTGFHPFSLWGARKCFNKHTAPFDARFLSRSVVQDWLELLGFKTVTGCVLNYQVPDVSRKWRKRLNWMNKAGDRWWPTLGAVYILVVKKHVYGGLGAVKPARVQPKWFPAANPAPAKVLQRHRASGAE